METVKPLIVAVDPGIHGAICFMDIEQRKPTRVLDMPIMSSIHGKLQVHPDRLASEILNSAVQIHFGIVEDVGVMGGHEGTVSMFNFGYGAGIVRGVLAAYLIPVYLVKPPVWKAALGLNRDKNESMKKASSLYPDFSFLWSLRKHEGRAEAVLLAHFGLTRLVSDCKVNEDKNDKEKR